MDSTATGNYARKYIDDVFRVAMNNCNDLQDARDVVQETFYKLLKSDTRFTDEEHVKRWLIRVAINECHNQYRKSWRKHEISLGAQNDLEQHTPNDANEDFSLELSEESIYLYAAIRELPLKYREILYLYYFEEYSIHEIMDILQITETNTKTRLLRARKKLETILKGAG